MDDKSVCSFYQKIGACRHGEKCSRRHIRPAQSKTVLLANLYQNPKVDADDQQMLAAQTADTFDHFYADVFKRLAKEGTVDQVVVCENENFHLSGNVYIKFTSTDAANRAVMLLNLEWYAGKPVYCELSPVTSFHEANCRAHDTNSCTRGDHCNFMHVRKPSTELRGRLRHAQEKQVALNKLRETLGDIHWGKEWEAATTRPYKLTGGAGDDTGESGAKAENGNKAENGKAAEAVEAKTGEQVKQAKDDDEDENDDPAPATTTEAVAKLFA